ncbi:MAG: CapA family protein [Nodosilinea sp.]
MIWRSKVQDIFSLINTIDLSQLSQSKHWLQAQAGDVGAIARLLAEAIGDSRVRVEVSWRDRTLYVFLTGVQPPHQNYVNRVRAVVNALGLEIVTDLKVLDGLEMRLLDRWQYDFSLDPLPPALPPQAAPRADATKLDSHHPAAALATAPEVDSRSRTGPNSPRWRWLMVAAAIALGFGLATGVTQWRNHQQVSSLAKRVVAAADPALDVSSDAVKPIQPLIEGTDSLTPPPLTAPATLKIKAVGDIIPGTDYQRYRLPEDWQYLFRSVQYHLGKADITFGNFESTLTEVPNSAKDTSRGNTFAFRTPPWYASVLKEAGFDVLNVANNHSMDFFAQGFDDTIANIEEAGMKAVGRKGEILYVEAQGQTVAFIGFSTYNDHNSLNDLDSAIALVKTADQQADIVVVSFHGGKEGTDATVTRNQNEYFYSENRGNLVNFSHTVIDHGADLVLGHGPHVPRAVELYDNKLIAYSLGNFLGYRSLSTAGALGTSLILEADLNAKGNVIGGRIIPVALDKNGVPYLDDYFGSVVLVRQFTQRDFPNTPLAIDDMGYIWPQ